MAEGKGRSRPPKDEEEFGNKGAARDGEPVEPEGGTAEGGMSPEDDELARKRAARSNGDALADQPLDGAGDDDPPEEDDGQFFIWEQGTKVTLGTLIRRGTPVEHAFVFGGRRTKGSGGLMGFDEKPLMIVRGKPGPVKIVPTYNDDEVVTKVTIENHVEATIVRNADSEDGLALVSHILDKRGYTRPAKAS